ncbi:ABC transporter ATP-binding protein [Intrasporangium calvum]|uniref:ABC transporter ATP-binding protein n=1 Tax=Intrasporangium calvum TaxID=53358 RepID=A0ABT5GEK4_9MICO|nr:ABC transporter ATP-binding protein [Intrasporangium calvum]MDC5696549.1 ABC transporter ATP-binding protein [Intrasporangium calvum]
MTEEADSTPPLLSLSGIRKTFGDLVANDGIDLTVRAGEVHAVLGENGAGKTTLMRIIYGLTVPDDGVMQVDGVPVMVRSPKDALACGIGMVTQHFALVRPMTVLENILLSSLPLGPVSTEEPRLRIAELSAQLGSPFDPDAVVGTLSVGEQQRVEIVKALYQGARALILDEPTAVLVPQECSALFKSLRRLTDDGIGVLFVSHKLHEVKAISDRVSVLRHGRVVTTVPTETASTGELAELLVGRAVSGVSRAVLRPDDEGSVGATLIAAERADDRSSLAAARPNGEVLLRISALTVPGSGAKPRLDGIHLDVGGGEILGLAGVSGNGQRELADVLSGVLEPSSGSVTLGGVELAGAGPARIVQAGLGRLPEDRHGVVVEDLSVEDNLILENVNSFRRGPFLDRGAIRRHAERLIEQFSIKAAPTDPVGGLSGGNMQKVLLARVFERDPQAIVVAQPTRGLDVGASEFVHKQLLRRRSLGAAILLISEDLDEVLALSDRIAVIVEGRIMGVVSASVVSRGQLGLLMSGTPLAELSA